MSSTRSRVLLALAWAAAAAILVARAGLYPAVMTGDEIWFAESAFNLVQHGQPQRLIHADAVGSAVADYLPPVIMLVQALAFSILGLTPFAVASQSVAAPLIVVALIFALARRAGAPLAWAGIASLAILGSQLFLRASLYIRYEALVALCFLAYLLATRLADDGGSRVWHVVRGALVALAGLSYYPLAPFVGIAALLFELGRWRLERLVLMALGFAVPAAAFALYVAQHPDVFAAQIIGNGSSNYVVFELIVHAFDPALWRQSKDALPELVGLAVFLVAVGWRLRDETRWVKQLWGAALITSVPILLYPFQLRLLALPAALVVLLLATWTAEVRRRRVARGLLIAGAVATAASGALILATAMLQQDGRRYDAVTQGLNRLITEPGPVAMDQRAWLALRATDPSRELHHVVPGWSASQVRIFESTILRDPTQGSHFRYVVLTAVDAAATIAATPALAAAFAAQQFTEIGRVAPPFRPLPWAGQPPYDLVVFARRD
ncbi:MAG: hypothetical protein JO021_10235 [Alphaproteobacteria bacterium]|nr:hypothetical protein [Alphaproteobacteria bacterium]